MSARTTKSGYNVNHSPVDWYLASYQLRFVELAESWNDDLERKFLVWTNTRLVKAASIEEAYDKAVAFGMDECRPYKGGSDGVDVQWLFEGLTELLPIYESIGDGAEIAWAKGTRVLKNIRRRSLTKEHAVRRISPKVRS